MSKYPTIDRFNKMTSYEKNKFTDNPINHLHLTLEMISSTIDDVQYIPHRYGGTFTKGNRRIDVSVDFRKKDYDLDENMKIHKWKDAYCVTLHRDLTGYYPGIKEAVKKGLKVGVQQKK